MIPQHILDVLNTLSPAQKAKFQDLCLWAGNSGVSGTIIPINYDSILEMIKNMGENPIVPVEAPKVVDYELLERINALKGKI